MTIEVAHRGKHRLKINLTMWKGDEMPRHKWVGFVHGPPPNVQRRQCEKCGLVEKTDFRHKGPKGGWYTVTYKDKAGNVFTGKGRPQCTETRS